MSRELTIAAAQMGPIARAETRPEVVERLLALLRDAAAQGAELVVFPELALTTFFPRWDLDEEEMLTFFEREMPSDETRPLFEAARLEGMTPEELTLVDGPDDAIALLRASLEPGDVVLVKASRAAGLERVALAIAQESPA